MRLLSAIACALVLVGCAGGSDAEAPAWNHDPEDAALGPAGWGEIDESFEECAVGTEQSPVDITGAEEADLPDLEFDYPETSLVVENTGHTIEATLPEDSDHALRIADDEYRLVQFHVHAPSEHTLDGKQYDGEVHLVHEAEDGRLAVVAVFLEVSDLEGPLFEAVLESAPDDVGEEVELEREWSPSLLLGVADSATAYGADYFTYPGSLTTPGCSGGVRWIVTPGPYPTSSESIEYLHELIGGFPDYDGYENNNRPTQPLNDRVIQRDAGY